MYVPKTESEELCDAFGFWLDANGKLLIHNRNNFSGTSEGAWQ